MLQGMCILKNKTLIALFDSGASHSFISLAHANELELPMSSFLYDLIVSTSIESRLLTSSVCLNCPIWISTYWSIIDLICLPMNDIDIILGMNWLSANNVFLNCQDKTIQFLSQNTLTTSLVEIDESLANQIGECLSKHTLGCVLL